MTVTASTKKSKVTMSLAKTENPPTSVPKKKFFLSLPTFSKSITLNSQEAQQVMQRHFFPVAKALYDLDVKLRRVASRVTGKQEAIDELKRLIEEHINEVDQGLEKSIKALEQSLADDGIQAKPTYTHPMQREVQYRSPQAGKFVGLICKLDHLVALKDSLWFHDVLSSQACIETAEQWQTRLQKLANYILEVEKSAHAAVQRQDIQMEHDQADSDNSMMIEENEEEPHEWDMETADDDT